MKSSGETRIREAFERARAGGHCALMPYLMLGYPDSEASARAVTAAASAGADMLELGVPFSDPIADGAVIQQAAYGALQNGTTLDDCLRAAARLRSHGVTVPFLLMGYYNPIFVRGVDNFAGDCRQAGVDGLIVPDLPPEEAGDLSAACRREGLALIFLVAPNTPNSRLAAIAAQACGFVYLVSRPGTTGARADLAAGLPEYIARVRSHTDLPLALGFGISTVDHVRQVSGLVDGVIVGSAVVEKQAQGEDAVAEFVSELAEATSKDASASSS